MKPLPPSQPLLDVSDDPDPVAEVGQRIAAATQTAQSAMTTWAIYGQRGSTATRERSRGELNGADQSRQEDRAERLVEVREGSFGVRARVRPLIPLDAGLDAIGEGSSLTEGQQDEVRRRFAIVTDQDTIAERTAQLLERLPAVDEAADEAAEAGAMWAGNDDNHATVSYIGGTNRRAGRSALVRDAIGDANEQAGEEAIVDLDDPMRGQARPDDGFTDRDPLTFNAWDNPDPMSVDPEQHRER